MIVAPQSYHNAADACYAVSKGFQAAYNPLQTALLETSGMAGSYQAIKAWSKSYDDRASAFVLAATNFARALQHLGDVLTAAGYNWECANYNANRNPNKGAGPTLPRALPSELPYGSNVVVGVASSRANSQGLDSSEFPGLYGKVTSLIAGGEIPDGDVDKLDRMATEWKKFATNATVFGARTRLKLVADGLERRYGHAAPRDIPYLAEHLRALATSAGEIELAANDLAAATTSHHAALATMRSDINTRFTAVVVGAAVTVAATTVVLYNRSTVALEGAALESAAAAIAGAIGSFFAALSGITFATAALATGGLAAIAGLAILIATIDDNSSAAHPTLGGDDPVTQEIAQRIADHAHERAQQGDGSHYVAGVAPADLAEYVRKVLDGEIPTEQRHTLRNGRVAYWDPEKGALVIEDKGAGTVYTPEDGREEFDGLE